MPTGKKDKDGKDKAAANDKDKAHDSSVQNGEKLREIQFEQLIIDFFSR